MSGILLADIGGTTSRLAFTGRDGRPERIVTIANDTLTGPESAILRLLNGSAALGAVLAVAGPVDGDEIALTNRAWRFRRSELSKRCGLTRLHVLNDFEALAWALPLLGESDIRPLGHHAAIRGTKVVLGPGTGLGVAALVRTETGWHAVASEGGHASFGACGGDEEGVFARLRESARRVSAETILSGPGLTRLHQALHPGAPPLPPDAIVAKARASDAAAAASIAMFVRMLGRFAGGVALTFKATGGVYIAGGVALGLGPLFEASLFRAAFENHPPYEKLLAAIPAALITYAEPGLLGCAAIAKRMPQEAEIA